jgi:hypothetical protein
VWAGAHMGVEWGTLGGVVGMWGVVPGPGVCELGPGVVLLWLKPMFFKKNDITVGIKLVKI